MFIDFVILDLFWFCRGIVEVYGGFLLLVNGLLFFDIEFKGFVIFKGFVDLILFIKGNFGSLDGKERWKWYGSFNRIIKNVKLVLVGVMF